MAGKLKMPGGRKVALITGSGRRLGRKSALALAEDGWDIVINYSMLRERSRAYRQGDCKAGYRSNRNQSRYQELEASR